jgi:hypothetical protein
MMATSGGIEGKTAIHRPRVDNPNKVGATVIHARSLPPRVHEGVHANFSQDSRSARSRLAMHVEKDTAR